MVWDDNQRVQYQILPQIHFQVLELAKLSVRKALSHLYRQFFVPVVLPAILQLMVMGAQLKNLCHVQPLENCLVALSVYPSCRPMWYHDFANT